MTMDWEDLFDWVVWLLLAFVFVLMLVVALVAIVFGVCLAIECVGGFFWWRRRRHGNANGNGNNKTTTTTLSIDDLLESIPDMAYQDLPPAAAAAAAGDHGDMEREVCAICVTPYEAGETCSLLPGCTHMFHKPCVAKWLRNKNTCPLCRATVGAGAAPYTPRRQADAINAAENMV